MNDVDLLKRNRLSVFSKEKPRAIYRNSDELPEEPPTKIFVQTSPIQAKPQSSIQSLQERLQQIQQSWQAPANMQQVTAQYQPMIAGSISNSNSKQAEDQGASHEKQGVQQPVQGQPEKDSPLEGKNRLNSFGKTTQNLPNVESERTVEPFQRYSLQLNAMSLQRPNYFQFNSAPASAQVQAVQAQPQSTTSPNQQTQQQTDAQAVAPLPLQPFALSNQQLGNQNIQQQILQQQQVFQTNQLAQQQLMAKQHVQKKSQVFLVNGVKYIGLREMGKGGSATVYQAMTSDLQQCALKIIQLKDDNDELCGKNAIIREIEILEKLKGLSITLDILQYQFTAKEAFIVMQLGDIDLKTFLKENPILSSIKILSLFEDMVEKTIIMHQAGFIHGDIKPHNFMFYHAKLMIIDFGISKQMQNQTTVFRDSLSGTPKYMAPEVIASQYREPGARIHRASDVWSLGCILYEMACNESPFDAILKDAKTPLVFIDILRRKQFKINFTKIQNQFIRGLAERMLEPDDNKRIPLDQVLYQLRQQ